MLLDYRCFLCILDDLAGALELLKVGDEKSRAIMKEAVALMAKKDAYEHPPSYFITEVHRAIKRETGIAEPFAELRAATNKVGVELAAKIRMETANLPERERFRIKVLWAVAANHLDFRTVGTGYGFDTSAIYKQLERQIEKGLTIDMIDEFYKSVRKGSRILYIHDNVGEVEIDCDLIEELRGMGAVVTSALRGGPITSDATMADGKTAGVFESADKVILAGPDTLGISLDEMTDDLRNALRESDLIVSKGQANYYVLTEYIKTNDANIVFLFSNKCDPVAEKFGLKGIHNLVFYSAEKKKI